MVTKVAYDVGWKGGDGPCAVSAAVAKSDLLRGEICNDTRTIRRTFAFDFGL